MSSSRDTFVFSPNRLTVGIGLKDLVVVDTRDALLIANRNDLGLVRETVEAMTVASYPEVAAEKESIRVLRISLAPGETTHRETLQDVSHHWIVLEGKVQVTIGKNVSSYSISQNLYVPPGLAYTIGNIGDGPLKLIEVICWKD